MAYTRQRRPPYSQPASHHSRRICRCRARRSRLLLLCSDLLALAFPHPRTTTPNKARQSSLLHLITRSKHIGCRHNHRRDLRRLREHYDLYQPTATSLPRSRHRKARHSLLRPWRMVSLRTGWLVLGLRVVRLYRRSMIRAHHHLHLPSVRSRSCLRRSARWRLVQASTLSVSQEIYP